MVWLYNPSMTPSTSSPSALSLVFVDTEFTSLGETGPPELISIGAVDYATEASFYLESADFNPELMSPFTRERVAPLLQRGELSVDFPILCERFFEFLSERPGQVVLAMDSPWDWAWVRSMAQLADRMDQPLADDPAQNALWPQNLRQDWLNCAWSGLGKQRSKAAWKARSAYFASHVNHHALSDAVGVRLFFKAALGPAFQNAVVTERSLAQFRAIFQENKSAPEPQGPRPVWRP